MKEKTVYYYNINYMCNNKCLFCFSYNVGNEKKEIEFEKIIEEIKGSNLNIDDTIVINGVEPTLSLYFEQLLLYLSKLKCRVVVYTNGRRLKDIKIPSNKNIQFVIPIHGDKKIHDKITQVKNSFQDTIDSIKYLQKKEILYSVKFIINNEMIEKNINVEKILENHELCPKEVVLARLNITKKSKLNNYNPPEPIIEKTYFRKCFEELCDKYDILLLDFPPCYLEDNLIVSIDMEKKNDVRFIFSDYSHSLNERKYLKKRLKFKECTYCIYGNICNLISESYYLLKYDKNEKAVVLALE